MPPGVGYPLPNGPPGGAPSRPKPFSGTESVFNPNDMAQRLSSGQVRPDMTVEELWGMMGIQGTDTIQEAAQKLKGQAQTATMGGKAQVAAGARPSPAAQPRPQGPAPTGAPTPPIGLNDLVGRR